MRRLLLSLIAVGSAVGCLSANDFPSEPFIVDADASGFDTSGEVTDIDSLFVSDIVGFDCGTVGESQTAQLTLQNNGGSVLEIDRFNYVGDPGFALIRDGDELPTRELVSGSQYFLLPPLRLDPDERVDLTLRCDCQSLRLNEGALSFVQSGSESESTQTHVIANLAHQILRLPPGTFTMGSAAEEVGHEPDEAPRHEVTLTHTFDLGAAEVTQEQWERAMGNHPSPVSCADCPVEHVSWWDAVAYMNRASTDLGLELCYTLTDCHGTPGDGTFACASFSFAGLDCDGFRLPTEAEWEYAARAGTITATYEGDITETQDGAEPVLDGIAWYGSNSDSASHLVMEKRANAWKLYDMLGNVAEWVHDFMASYPSESSVDPLANVDGGLGRVIRGGSYTSAARDVRAGARAAAPPEQPGAGTGFRVARTIANAPPD